jgi:hypothetical protein
VAVARGSSESENKRDRVFFVRKNHEATVMVEKQQQQNFYSILAAHNRIHFIV